MLGNDELGRVNVNKILKLKAPKLTTILVVMVKVILDY